MDFIQIVGRFGLAVNNPDGTETIVRPEKGAVVRLVPYFRSVNLLSATPPEKRGIAVRECSVDDEGYLVSGVTEDDNGTITDYGVRGIDVEDLSSGDITPRVADDAGQWRAEYLDFVYKEPVTGKVHRIDYTSGWLDLESGEVNDLSVVGEVAAGGGQPIVSGPQGRGIAADGFAVDGTVLRVAMDDGTTEEVGPYPSSSDIVGGIAGEPTVRSAAATAAQSAIAAAGQRTFFNTAGAPGLLAYPRFDVAPGNTSSNVPGNWYNVTGTPLSWEQVTDGPYGGTARVIRAVGVNNYFRQRRQNWAIDGLVGKTITVEITARALPANGETTATVRPLITRVSNGAVLLDTRVGTFGTAWSTRTFQLLIPADIGDAGIQFAFGVHGSNPVGSGQLEFGEVRAYVAGEDIGSVVGQRVTVEATKAAGGVWTSGTAYPVGATIVTALGHRLRCVTAHTSATRFTDDLPKWLPSEEPPRERRLLAQSALGHGQVIGVGNKIVVALRFDDWHTAFRDNVLPLLLARSLPAALASISNLTAQPWVVGITPADIKSWNRQGIEIQSHGVDHKDPSPNDLMGAGGLADQIINSKATIESWGVNCRGWMQPGATPLIAGVTPYGTDATSWESIDQYAAWLIRNTYPVSETYVWGSISRPIPHRQFHGADHLTISDGMTYADTIATLEQRIVRGENIELMIHAGNIGGTGNMTLAEIAAVFDWIVTKRDQGLVEVLTPSGLFFADRSTQRAEAIRNGSFAEGTGGWSNFNGTTRTVETSGGRTGPNFARMGSTDAGLVSQSILTLRSRGWQGHTFEFLGYARAMSATTAPRVTLAGSDLAIDRTFDGVGTAWTPIRIPLTIPPDATSIAVAFGRSSGGGVEWDDISVRPI